MELVGFAKDATERQLRQIFNAHIDPPISGLRFEEVEFSASKFILAFRIPRGWNRPHCVLATPPLWQVRDGNHKRHMKVGELRDGFGAAQSVSDRMKRFRAERIATLVAGENPAAMAGRSLIVLHVMPLRSFDDPLSMDLRTVVSKQALLFPMPTALRPKSTSTDT